MPRKKPEAIVALEAIEPAKPLCSCGETAIVREDGVNRCERCYVAAATERAASYTQAVGMARQPGESAPDYRKRALAWIRERAKLKTFNDAVKAEDEWSTGA